MAKQLTLAYLIEGISNWHPPEMEMPVRPILDSRKAEANTVFFAFQGEQVDGHNYVADAFARGAVAAVIEHDVDVQASTLDVTQPLPSVPLTTPLLIRVPNVLEALQNSARFWRQQLNPRVIGVTGSVGKTTTKEVVTKMLSSHYRVMRSTGSFNNEIGLPLTLLNLTDEYERVILEMGMYVRGDIRFLHNPVRNMFEATLTIATANETVRMRQYFGASLLQIVRYSVIIGFKRIRNADVLHQSVRLDQGTDKRKY